MSTSAAEVKTIVEQGYDAIAPAYHKWASPRPTQKRAEYIRRLGQSLSKGSKVLELGCGAGIPATQQLVDQGFDVLGVDISSAQIALAKEHVPAAKYMQGDMMGLELAQGSFDAVMAFYSLFHLPREEHGPMLGKMIGWLKPGGWLLFNLRSDDGEFVRDDWMGAKMFSFGLGIEGNRKILESYRDEFTDVEDLIDVEIVGRFEEKFHWVWAKKRV
ncbi:hypothetical protein D9757_009407 [Collybiopsis confluens]|uniref:Methyltransferase domain-containing protein n=1 Tax=Collybiopsis confluens TaxID=2823264 RepID=A0A8H5HD54_9AGAR|nr:hypothetical protein D9757_009407 [Collybiopsis confluens]